MLESQQDQLLGMQEFTERMHKTVVASLADEKEMEDVTEDEKNRLARLADHLSLAIEEFKGLTGEEQIDVEDQGYQTTQKSEGGQ